MFAFFCTGRPADINLFMWFFLFCFVLWISFQNRFIWRYQSFFWCIVVLIIVTRVLALCRDGWKQMSDLPFLLKNKSWHTELMTQNSISNAWVICMGQTVNILLGRLSCCLRTVFDEASSTRVCRHTYSDELSKQECWPQNGCCGGRAHSWTLTGWFFAFIENHVRLSFIN